MRTVSKFPNPVFFAHRGRPLAGRREKVPNIDLRMNEGRSSMCVSQADPILSGELSPVYKDWVNLEFQEVRCNAYPILFDRLKSYSPPES